MLVVAALELEAAHVQGFEVLITGVGKAHAAAVLAKRFADAGTPDLVVNLGTAGAVATGRRGLFEVGYITQHDFPYDDLAALVGPIRRGFALGPGQPPAEADRPDADDVVLATGDRFVADPDQAAAIAAAGIHLVDMEAYAVAATCAAFSVPMRCVKAVSDAADSDAVSSWLDGIDACARDLAAWLATAAFAD